MKKPIIALAVVLIGSLTFAEPTPAPGSLTTARLVVKIVDLRNQNGHLIFSVFDQKQGFPSEEKRALNWQVREFNAGVVVFTCDLPPGKYGASVLHDENDNNKMDTNLVGIPKEGYGVTNNPKPRFRAATFEDSVFDLPAEGAEVTISLQYF